MLKIQLAASQRYIVLQLYELYTSCIQNTFKLFIINNIYCIQLVIMDTNIRIYETTKNRLDVFKGRKSYNSMLEEMLSYFELTGITPSSRITSPDAVMKEQSSRVIEVMRGIEKKENITLNAIYDLLKSVSLNVQQNEKTETSKDDDENFIHVNDVQDLLDRYKDLEKLYSASEEKNKSHLIEIELLKARTTSEDMNESVDTDRLLEIVETIENRKKPATFNSSIYEIERTVFDAWMTRLKNELTR